MWYPISLVVILGLFCLNTCCESFSGLEELESEKDIWERQIEVPSIDNFGRRALHSTVTLGQYLYIDGGEINQLVNGKADTEDSRPVNITTSISLTGSWTNSSVAIKSIPRTAPNANLLALWPDPAANKIYAWGGTGPYSNTTGGTDVKLWAFTPDDLGSGSWAPSSPANPTIFNTLLRGTNGASTSCNRVGFYLGGKATSISDARVSSDVALPGLLTYDMSTSTWNNRTAPAPYNTFQDGKAVCLPFGPNGLVMFLGGGYGLTSNADRFFPILFDNVTFYDEVENRWFWQMTTGSIPDNRSQFCVVGVEGNGTFEIFIYGGFANTNFYPGTPQDLPVFNDIYILTLPAFHWIKTNITSPPRWAHSCSLVGKGGRQMLSSGGVPTFVNPWTSSSDPWDEGLGVLDLSELRWSEKFDGVGGGYVSPGVVEEFYGSGGLEAVNWQSDTVKELFVNASTASTSPTPTPQPSTSSSNTGAIAGGVVGGIAFLAILAGLAFFYHRRKKASLLPPQDPGYENVPSGNGEGGGNGDGSSRYTWLAQKAELESRHTPKREAVNAVRQELPGGGNGGEERGVHELGD